MGKIGTILELIKLLQPYLTQLLPLVKAIIEAIKKAKEDKPVVGAAPIDPADLAAGVDMLEAAGMTTAEAQAVLK